MGPHSICVTYILNTMSTQDTSSGSASSLAGGRGACAGACAGRSDGGGSGALRNAGAGGGPKMVWTPKSPWGSKKLLKFLNVLGVPSRKGNIRDKDRNIFQIDMFLFVLRLPPLLNGDGPISKRHVNRFAI